MKSDRAKLEKQLIEVKKLVARDVRAFGWKIREIAFALPTGISVEGARGNAARAALREFDDVQAVRVSFFIGRGKEAAVALPSAKLTALFLLHNDVFDALCEENEYAKRIVADSATKAILDALRHWVFDPSKKGMERWFMEGTPPS